MAGVFVYSDNIEVIGELTALAQNAGQDVNVICMKESHASECAGYAADRVYILNGESSLIESYSGAIADLLLKEKATAFLAGATIRGRDLAAQVASRCDCAMVSEASDVEFNNGAVKTKRYMYGGLTEIKEECSDMIVITVVPGMYTPSGDTAKTAEVIIETVDTDSRIRLLESSPVVKEGTDLSKASRIVCVGMGFDKKEDITIADELAKELDAEVGCTRPVAEDREWLPAELYIGISGAVVKPDLYIGLGVSGQIQHTFGIRDSKIIVGINNNDKATIFQNADYGIVGDLYEIIPLLKEAISSAR